MRKFQQLSKLQNSVTLVVSAFPGGRILHICFGGRIRHVYCQKHFFISGSKSLDWKMSLKRSPRGRITISHWNNDQCCKDGYSIRVMGISLISVLKRCRTQLQTSFQRRYLFRVGRAHNDFRAENCWVVWWSVAKKNEGSGRSQFGKGGKIVCWVFPNQNGCSQEWRMKCLLVLFIFP